MKVIKESALYRKVLIMTKEEIQCYTKHVKGGRSVVNVIWADQHINVFLNQGPWKVHSVYEHAINLVNPFEMWTLVTQSKPKAPMTCVCNLQSFLTFDLNVGLPCITSQNQMSIGSLTFDLSQASTLPYDHDVHVSHWKEIDEGYHKLLRWCLAQLMHEGAMGLFNSTSEPFSKEVVKIINNFIQGELHQVKKLVGCGIGQTPTGDDVIVGMMALAYALGHIGFIEVVSHMCEPHLKDTTPVSQMMLRHAFKGRFNEVHTKLIKSLKYPHLIHEAAIECSKLGHSSGFDMMVGILVYGMWLKKGETNAKTNTDF